MDMDIESGRRAVTESLLTYGITIDPKTGKPSVDDLRRMQNQLAYQMNQRGTRYAKKHSHLIAQPEEIDIDKIDPCIVFVDNTRTSQIWLYAATYWTVPITTGYGRRVRFLIFDRSNGKLIGIVGLCDPVIGLAPRDKLVGWNTEQKNRRLYNCLTAYVLGAVPPYNTLLGAKLVALLLKAEEVREHVYSKYEGTQPVLSGRSKEPFLVHIDTMAAFGKSAIYNRLEGWSFVGYTKGQSHLHITANGSWETIRKFVPEEKFKSYAYGDGPNWKIRVLKQGLEALGFSNSLLDIGWSRAYYSCPLAENWRSYLLGETDTPVWVENSTSELLEYWKTKWVLPRIQRLQSNLFHHTETPPHERTLPA